MGSMDGSFFTSLTEDRQTRRKAAVAVGAMLWMAAVLGAAPAASARVPVNTVGPHVSGEASVGATLTTTNGAWTGSPHAYEYQWRRCTPEHNRRCWQTTISKGVRYVVRASDVGATIYAGVRARNAHGWSRYVSSTNRIGPIAPQGAPVNTSPPYVAGNLAPARLVSTTDGIWAGSVAGYHYQWFECDPGSSGRCAGTAELIDGATDPSYVINPRLVGDDVYSTVSAYNRYGSGRPVKSNVIGPVTGSTNELPPFNETPPSIRGTATVGSTLSVDLGDWDGLPDAYSYGWRKCSRQTGECQQIGQQTGPTYVVTGEVIGDLIRVSVAVRNGGGWSEAAVSGAVGPVPAR